MLLVAAFFAAIAWKAADMAGVYWQIAGIFFVGIFVVFVVTLDAERGRPQNVTEMTPSEALLIVIKEAGKWLVYLGGMITFGCIWPLWVGLIVVHVWTRSPQSGK